MPKDVVAKLIGTTQEIKKKSRKSLQTLQISADEQKFARKIMVLPNDEIVPSKKKQLKPIEKVITVEKENAPNLRRSKRKTTVSDLLNYAELPDDTKTSKSTSKTKSKRNVPKPNKGKPPTQKKNKLEVNLNQTKLNSSTVTSVLSKISDIPESANAEKSILGTSSSLESEITEDSGLDPSNGVSAQSPTLSTVVSESFAVKGSSISPDNENTSILTSVSPPLSYWKDLAEQRRLALEETLRENELICDQLVVLEAENSQLKQLLQEAKNLAQVVMGIIE